MTRVLYSLCGADATRPFSPHAWKIVMALHHKGLAFEERPTPFTGISVIENGATKTVPLLVDGDQKVTDSFAIAAYLDATYPDRPSLFGGAEGMAATRLIEGYSQMIIQPALVRIVVFDIWKMLAPADQAYFRASREARLGRTLEEVDAAKGPEIGSFGAKLEPMRHMLKFQPWIGGEKLLFGDYILFGALQWARIVSPTRLLNAGDPVYDWFERALDLHHAAGRSVTEA
jgi:glutathione S-transferase